MTSTAISAQGTTLQIGTGSGGAITVSGGAPGFPTILTATAHGRVNGDVATIAAIVGTMGTDATNGLNGKTFVIKNATANTFAIDANTTGLVYTSGGTATPVTFTTIGNVKTFTGFDGQASELDRSNFASTAKEFILGLVDFGQFSFDTDYDYTDAGQTAVLAAQVSGLIKTFKLTLPDSHTATFTAYAKKMPTTGGVDQIVKRAGTTLRISGAVTWA
jgi:hypothetical protein